MQLVTMATVDVTTYFHLRLAATGADATGLTITNFDLQYVRAGAAPAAKVDATALAATDSAHGDNQAIEVDATDQPGVYRVDWPDAAFAAGVNDVYLTVKCATAFTETLHVRLMPVVRGLTGTAVPNAAADAAGGLIISDAGGLDADAQLVTKINDILTDTGTTLQAEIDGVQADTEDLQTSMATLIGYVDTEIAAILEDTSTTLDNLVDDLEARLSAALAAKLTAHAAGVLVLVVDTGSSTTEVVFKTVEGTTASATNDFYNGRVVIFTSGALAGQATSISDYVGASKTATVVALTGTPAEDVTAVIV